MASVVQEAEAIMAEYMTGYDSSHDMYHVRRVRDMAMKIAKDVEESRNTRVDLLVVELAAIFHDLVDHKYSKDSNRINVLRELLQRYQVSTDQSNIVVRIVENTGYSKERQLKEAGLWTDWHDNSIEFGIVQDADRLDAMGAFGIMRVAAYACRVNHPLLDDPNPNGRTDSAHQHFYDKLLKLSSTIRTPLGKQMASKRHSFMMAFLEQLQSEYALAS